MSRLQNAVRASFGTEALVLNLPSRDTLGADENLDNAFSMFMAGNNADIRDAFARVPTYWLEASAALDWNAPNGFRAGAPPGSSNGWHHFRLTTVNAGSEPPRLATDDWPMLYLR